MSAGTPLWELSPIERMRRLREDTHYSESGFIAGDAPIGAKMPFRQENDLDDLREIAFSEGSAITDFKAHVDLRLSYGENRQILLDLGAKLREGSEAEKRRQERQAEAVQGQAERAAFDWVYDTCRGLDGAGYDGVDLLFAVLEGAAPGVDDPGLPGIEGIDVSTIEDSLDEMLDAFSEDLVASAIEKCARDMERFESEDVMQLQERTETGEVRPDPVEVAERVTAGLQDADGPDDAVVLDAIGALEWESVSEAVTERDLPEDAIRELRSAFEATSDDVLGEAADVSGKRGPNADAADALVDLLLDLEVRVPAPPAPTFTEDDLADVDVVEVTDEMQAAIDEVERLLEAAPGRGLEWYRGIEEALRLEDAIAGVPLSADTIDALPEQDRERLADLAGERARVAAVEELSRSDFPVVEQATDRGPGRSVAYFRGLIQEFEGNLDPDTLEDQGVSDDQLDLLFEADHVREEFVEKCEENIDALENGGRGPAAAPGGGSAGLISEAVGNRREAEARRLVPPADRHDYLADEDWTASPAQLRLERTFVQWLLEERGDVGRWSPGDFQLQPENRDISMAAYARLQARAGNVNPGAGVRLGLPEEWFQDQDGDQGDRG